MPFSAIRFFSYDAPSRNLRIALVSGKRYDYLRVPEQVHAGLRRANSKGEYFNARIRGHYPCREIMPAKARIAG